MSTTETTHPDEPRAPPHVENSTDATRGEPLALRAQKRKAELEVALNQLPADELRARSDIELALSSVEALLTGDLEKLSDATGSAISRWLENTKHLAETSPGTPPMPMPPTPMPPTMTTTTQPMPPAPEPSTPHPTPPPSSLYPTPS